MNWRKALALLLVTSIIVGCASDAAKVSGRKRTKSYATVVSLSPSTTEYLVTDGGATYLAGRTSSCDRPAQLLSVPVVVGVTGPNIAKITEISPDLIIYDKALYGDDAVAKIEQMGFETLEFDPHDIDSYSDFGYKLASKLSLETFNESHQNNVVREMAAASANITTKPRTTVLLGKPEDGNYLVMGLEGIHSYLIKGCGGTPVGAGGKLFQPAKVESLIEWNPEIIYSDANAQAVYNDPRLQQVAAVKNQRVYDFDPKTLVRVGGNLDGIIKIMAADISKMPINPRKVAAK